MPRKPKTSQKPEITQAHLTIRVERYDASVEASVNYTAYAPQYSWRDEDNDPLFRFISRLTINGTFTGPKERAGDAFELTLHGDDAPSRGLDRKLKDAQVRDDHSAPKYRPYRGKQIPIYDPPQGLGFLGKVRGERRWTAWLFVLPRFVDEALILLGHQRPLFLGILECKDQRTRWIRSIKLQTTDPTDE